MMHKLFVVSNVRSPIRVKIRDGFLISKLFFVQVVGLPAAKLLESSP